MVRVTMGDSGLCLGDSTLVTMGDSGLSHCLCVLEEGVLEEGGVEEGGVEWERRDNEISG